MGPKRVFHSSEGWGPERGVLKWGLGWWGPQRVGPRRVGGPKFRAFFFSLLPQFSFFLPSLEVCSRGILVVFQKAGKLKCACTFGLSGCRVKPRQLGSCVEGAPCIFDRRPQWSCVQWPLGSEAGCSQARHGPARQATHQCPTSFKPS